MIRRIEEFDMYVAIAGFKDIKIDEVEAFFANVRDKLSHAEAVQFFNAKLIATWQHLYFAAVNALTAFAGKTNICNNLAMETLLYVSAQRQITKATRGMGITSRTSDIAVLVLAKTENQAEDAIKYVQKLMSAKRDDTALEINRQKLIAIKRYFGISDVEFSAELRGKGFEEEALVDLVIEHGALLATQR